MIQGDVMAAISLLVGCCLSAWALTMAYGLLFPAKSEVAKLEVAAHPWRCVGRGVLVLFTFGLFGLILAIKVPSPPIKLVGWIVLLSIFSVAALGMAGIALNAGDRLRRMGPELSNYAAFARGAAFLIVGCILPVVGWLAFGPVLYLAAIGAGFKAMFTRVEEASQLMGAETA